MSNSKDITGIADNDDIPVDLSGPVFDGQAVAGTLTDWERVDGDDGSATIVLHWETDGRITSTDGKVFEAGYKLRDRLRVKPPSTMNNAGEVSRIAWESLGRLLQALGALDGGAATKPQMLVALGNATGKSILLVLKRDKNDYQQLRYKKLATAK